MLTAAIPIIAIRTKMPIQDKVGIAAVPPWVCSGSIDQTSLHFE